MKTTLYFTCPKCGEKFSAKGWIKWIFFSPFHWLLARKTKCSKCGKYSYVTWEITERNKEN